MEAKREPLGRGRRVSGLAGAGTLRWAEVDLTEICETLRQRRDLTPLTAVALGQLLSGAALLWRLQLKTPARLILDLDGDGLLGRLTAEATMDGRLRGAITSPQAVLPDGAGDLNVGAALGSGLLRVIRQREDGTYESKVPILEGLGVSHQLSHYLEQSEQTNSAILLGVLVRPDGVAAAGGMMVEALPGTDEDLVRSLEERLGNLGDGVSRILEESGLEGLRRAVLGEMEQEFLDETELSYQCNCERERFRLRIASLSQEDRDHIFADGEDGEPRNEVTAECNFCGEVYRFTPEEVEAEEPPG